MAERDDAAESGEKKQADLPKIPNLPEKYDIYEDLKIGQEMEDTFSQGLK